MRLRELTWWQKLFPSYRLWLRQCEDCMEKEEIEEKRDEVDNGDMG